MPSIQNQISLPPGLSIPSSLQQKINDVNKATAPFKNLGGNQYGPSVKTIGKGSLIHFNYSFWKHDPYPLIIVCGIWNNYISGINLHYLTFPYIKRILQPQVGVNNCENRGFGFNNIRGNQYVINAFRLYKRAGIKSLKSLDCSFILNVMASVRAINPQEIENIRRAIQEQMKAKTQPLATEIKYTGMIEPQKGFVNPTPHPVFPPEGIV